jgi:hypothetical protein
MTERPILMSAPMVRAILEGAKSQTRRVVKPQPVPPDRIEQWNEGWAIGRMRDSENAWRWLRCPYGKPGEQLWVRETWAPVDERALVTQRRDLIAYAASTTSDGNEARKAYGVRWRPSIHMPRWASRITLELIGVRVERLQDIRDVDAVAEGVNPSPCCQQADDTAGFHRIGKIRGNSFPIARYAVLWESINGAGSWDANPWVWVVEFRRC